MTDASQGETAFLSEAGELGQLIRGFDWAATPIGPIAGWPIPMKAVLSFILRSKLPIVTLWGDTGVMIYNDAYRAFAGGRHPAILGTNVLEGWHEVADFNANVMAKVYRAGGTLSYKDQELTLVRDGTPRKLWTDLEYSPALDEAGRPIGVVAIVVETTDKVLADQSLGEERRRLLQMAEQSPGFMALLEGPEHRIVMHNPAYQRVVGNRTIFNRTVAEALPDAAAQGFVDILDTVFRTGEAFNAIGAKYNVQAEEGGPIVERFVDFVYQPVRGSDGAISGIFVSGVDVTDRTHAQSAIQASETQFRTFAQVAPNHIWTATPLGALDWFNDQMLLYCSRSSRELEGVSWTDIIHVEDRAEAIARWLAALETSTTYETEFRIRRADGMFRWHLVRALPILDQEGRIIRWIGTNTDIHEQKLAQAESAADRNRLWTMSRDLMLVCTYDGLITAVNPTAFRLLGWDESEMVGRPVSAFVHEDDVAKTAAEFERLTRGLSTLAFENRYQTKDGSFRLIAWTAVPDADRIHAVGRDVTDERRVARDRERIWTLSPILKAVTDAEGIVSEVNPSWTEVLGWSRSETVGRRNTEFLANGAEGWTERVQRLRHNESLRDYETVMRTKDGGERIIKWMTVPEEGTFYAFGRDVTAEVEAATALAETEAALRQSQKMEAVGQLTGGIAHDFNNLLQGITGSLEIVQRRITQGRINDLDRFITGASTAANRAAALTHRLLAFSRRQPLDPKPIRANGLVASMEDLFRRTIGERVVLDLVLSAGLWMTRCDQNQLENAILNLVINARDAMPDGGRLTIETCNTHLDAAFAAHQRGVRPGYYVAICVTDTGVGMNQDTIGKAFEPFFTTKPIGQGTGLGLSMIYGFAQQSEGYAKIESEVGKGTTVKLFLPRFLGEEVEDEAIAHLGHSQAAEDGEVVLVVEDEPIVRGLIVEELRGLGYLALEASNGGEGLEILQSAGRIDLLVTDIGLPGLNGRQIADAARQFRPHLKVLFMTGYAENAAASSGFLEPGMEMITKPFAMETLANRIRTIIEGSD